MLLQSSSQQVVEAGNHRSGVVVQARCDHGIVVDLRRKINTDKREKITCIKTQTTIYFYRE